MVGGPTAAPLESPPRRRRSSALALWGQSPTGRTRASLWLAGGKIPPADPPKEGILLATARPANGSFPFLDIAL